MKKSTAKFKLLLIFCYQLIIIILLAMFANMLLKRIGDSSANILANNLSSVKCCADMQRALSGLRGKPDQLQLRSEFENALQAELNSPFEVGEKEIAEDVKTEYFQWTRAQSDDILRTLRANIRSINEMNISAMRIKEMETQEMATHAPTYIIVISALGALAAFLFTFIFIGRLIQPPPPLEESEIKM